MVEPKTFKIVGLPLKNKLLSMLHRTRRQNGCRRRMSKRGDVPLRSGQEESWGLNLETGETDEETQTGRYRLLIQLNFYSGHRGHRTLPTELKGV